MRGGWTSAIAFERITADPSRLGGVPCIRRLRIPVATVVGLVAEGRDDTSIIDLHPDLEPEDIAEALRYAAAVVRERQVPLTASSP